MPQAAATDEFELGLSLARRLHGSRRFLLDRNISSRNNANMTVSTSTPLRSITARPLAHITTSSASTSSMDTISAALRSLDAAGDPIATEADATSSATIMTSAEDPSLSASMRSFAVIVCNECMYLEFPGCDVHGVLYTERAPNDETGGSGSASPLSTRQASGGISAAVAAATAQKFHAKCPKCTAATNNVRPFREGCRRCKAATTVHMWSSTLSEITQAHEAFPTGCEETEHTALMCELCASVVFPRARETLTKRTAEHAMSSSNGKPLQVSNFQLSMPHVEGCPRKGMPLQTVAVQLTKSELKFVLERIDQCPFTVKIVGGPQYRKRKQDVATQQNHLHQIYLRVLSTVVDNFDPLSPNALEPLEKVVALFDRLEPLVLFHEWSPPRALSKTQHKPSRVEASSSLDDQHSAESVLSTTSQDCWRPSQSPSAVSTTTTACSTTTCSATASAPTTDDTTSSEWIQFHFTPPVALSCVDLQWHSDFCPAQYSVALTLDDGSVETAAVVVGGRVQQTVPFAQRTAIVSVRITVFATAGNDRSACGLQCAVFEEVGMTAQHVSTESIVRDLQQWLLRASLSSADGVRDAALVGLQRLTLASGSLCGLMQLATALLLNVSPLGANASSYSSNESFDDQDWTRLDRLSASLRGSTAAFVAQFARNVLTIMIANDDAHAGENLVVENRVLLQMERAVAQSMSAASPPHALGRVPSPKAVCASTEDEQSDSPLYPYITMAACQHAFAQCITRRSHLGMVVLLILSELSAWQMKRMQKAEEYAGKKEEELMQLEEPLSLEVRPQLFDLSHRLLCHVLSSWVAAPPVSSGSKSTTIQNLPLTRSKAAGEAEEKEQGQSKKDTESSESAFDREAAQPLGVDLYNMLTLSFDELGSALGESGFVGASQNNRKPSFSADAMCGSIVQIITSNIRRLVLSRVDPVEIGIEAAAVHDDSDLLSAPPALQPMVATLEQLITLGTKRSDKFFSLSLKAAAAMEVGMEAFYPSAHQRTKLLTSRMGTGATLEVQVRWPVAERDQEDPRFERLILMLQFECIRNGFTHAIRGRWQFFMHLVVQVPSTQDTQDVLQRHFAPLIQQAGFSSWQVVAGAQEISINLQRHLHWNRVEKMSHDSGAGWIRVYPRDVAIFDDVLGDVDLFLADYDKRSAAKASPRP